jgi:hypothetical protein
MARPQTNKVDYFPHPVTHGKKMSYLEKKYKNDGYATWFKILEELCNTDYHYLDLSDDVQLMFLSDRCLVTETMLIDIINDLIRLKEFDKELWDSSKILFNEKFTESIKDAYKKRTNECISKKSLRVLLSSLGILKPIKSNPKPIKCKSEGVVKPQSKVKETKVDKTKEKKEEKKLAFQATLKPFLEKYGSDMLNNFYSYWTQEAQNSKTKMLFEIQKGWSISHRLSTWKKKDFDKPKDFKKEQQTDVDRKYSTIPKI